MKKDNVSNPKQIEIKTVSELINVLQWLQDQYGDLPVGLDVFDISTYPQSIDAVTYSTDNDNNKSISINSY